MIILALLAYCLVAASVPVHIELLWDGWEPLWLRWIAQKSTIVTWPILALFGAVKWEWPP
jgi:hypothetical protein